MCAYLQPHLWFVAVAVLVCSFPVFTFVSFGLFCSAFKGFDDGKHAPITRLTSLAPPYQIFSFVCCLLVVRTIDNTHMWLVLPLFRVTTPKHAPPHPFAPMIHHYSHTWTSLIPSPAHFILIHILPDFGVWYIVFLSARLVWLFACFGVFPPRTYPNPKPEHTRSYCFPLHNVLGITCLHARWK